MQRPYAVSCTLPSSSASWPSSSLASFEPWSSVSLSPSVLSSPGLVKALWLQTRHQLSFSLDHSLTTSIPARVKRAQAAFNPHCSQSDCHPHLSSSLTLSSSLYSPAPSVWCFLLFLVSLTYLLRFHTIQFTYFVFTNHWFLVYLQLCSHLCDLNLQHFHHPPKKPYTH